MQAQRKQIYLTIHPLAALLVLLQLYQVFAQVESEGDKATKKFLNNVVQLNVNFSNEGNESGFGFVVGERDQLLYVVTANHVVRKDAPDVHATNIDATFYSYQGDPKKAKLLNLSPTQVDLALLEVSKPPGYRWETDCLSSPRQNSTVWFIGRDGEWWVPADIEAGIIKEPPILPTFSIRIRSVQPGTSGAPLISKEGIIGMIVNDDHDKAEALNIETIHNFVTLKWHYPWGLNQGGGKIPEPDPPILPLPVDVKAIKPKAIKVYKNKEGFWEADYGDGIKMIYIPKGKFTMGSSEGDDDEKPPHEISLDGYWMGKTEVTVKQFRLFVKDTGYVTYAEKVGGSYTWTGQDWGYKKGSNWKNTGFKQGDNHPVVCISWNDAIEYCDWFSRKKGLNFKLPKEAQWEKAARWTDSRKYPWGSSNTYDNGKWFANYAAHDNWDERGEDGFAFTAPVGSYPQGKSPYGLLDMAGNVWEWCSDRYKADSYKDSETPKQNISDSGGDTYRVMRGGSWNYKSVYLRCANRSLGRPSSRNSYVGFRLCQDN